ncbi:MAG: hypothetical protein ACI4II_00020 [Acutalibacteraceae bacterium]
MNKKRIILITIIILALIGVGAYNELKDGTKSPSTSYSDTRSSSGSAESTLSSTPECEHDWIEATCTTPSICSKCGEKRGSVLGHNYEGVTCTTDGKCTRCGDIEPALGHAWKDADCTTPKTCSICGKTKGKALGHTTDNGICERCGLELFKPIKNSGHGDSAISDIKTGSGLYTIHFKHDGNSNFIVYLYDDKNEKDIIINEIGNYDGTVLLTGDNPYMLNIKADGNWSYTIDKLSTTNEIDFSGHGDFVTPIFSGSTSIYKFTHDGNSNFVVRVYSSKGYDLLINEIGDYNGTQIVEISGSAFFEINADGKWSIEKQ